MSSPVVITAAVEGIVDEAVARKLIAHVGGAPGAVYAKNGKAALRDKIKGYNNAARHAPWLVLVDLNGDAECGPPLRQNWLPSPAPLLCFRVAVRQVEAWLLSDVQRFASYIGVPRAQIPDDPEHLPNAKIALINLVRRSRRKAIREDMVPREGSGRPVGPAYSSRMIDYVETKWRPAVAAKRCESLRRAINCLTRLVKEA